LDYNFSLKIILLLDKENKSNIISLKGRCLKMKGLANLRKARGITQRELAIAMDVEMNTVWKWEHEYIKPSVKTAQKLADFFGAPINELLNDPADSEEIKFSFVMDIKEVESMDVRMNEFKVGTGDNDIFGLFRVSKDMSVEEIGQRFMNYLRAELAGDKVKRDELKKLNG
jgi:transcriptional regulator with XRE-family HTH domain